MINHLKNLYSRKDFIFRKPSNDFIERVIVNTAIIITLFSFLFMVSSCSYYRSVTRVDKSSGDLLTAAVNDFYPEFGYPRDQYPLPNLYKLFFMEHHLYLLDSIERWDLSEVEIKNDTVYATALLSPNTNDTLKDPHGDGISVRYNPKAQSELLMRVFIYSDKVDFNPGSKASFNVNDISRVITFKNSSAAKIGFTVLILGGVLTIALLYLAIISIGNFTIYI